MKIVISNDVESERLKKVAVQQGFSHGDDHYISLDYGVRVVPVGYFNKAVSKITLLLPLPTHIFEAIITPIVVDRTTFAKACDNVSVKINTLEGDRSKLAQWIGCGISDFARYNGLLGGGPAGGSPTLPVQVIQTGTVVFLGAIMPEGDDPKEILGRLDGLELEDEVAHSLFGITPLKLRSDGDVDAWDAASTSAYTSHTVVSTVASLSKVDTTLSNTKHLKDTQLFKDQNPSTNEYQNSAKLAKVIQDLMRTYQRDHETLKFQVQKLMTDFRSATFIAPCDRKAAEQILEHMD